PAFERQRGRPKSGRGPSDGERDTPSECHRPQLRRRRDGRPSRGGVRTPVRDRSERRQRHGGRYRAVHAKRARLAGWFWEPQVLWQLDARRGPDVATPGIAPRGLRVRIDPSVAVYDG